MDSLVSQSSCLGPSVDWWSRLIAAHADAMARYKEASTTQGSVELEEDVDGLLQELSQIERDALRQPSSHVAALRFKIGLWANGRVEGYEAEWRIFSQDCERFLPPEGSK